MEAKLTFNRSELGFLITCLESRILYHESGKAACSKVVSGMIVEELRSLAERLKFEYEKIVVYENREN